MNFKTYCHYLSRLEAISSRTAKTEILAELFKALKQEYDGKSSADKQIDIIIYIMLGSITASYDALEFNLSTKLVLRSLTLFNKGDLNVDRLYQQNGDIGLTAEQLAVDKISAGLSITVVHQKLLEIATVSGKDSQNIKNQLLQNLFNQLDATEIKYICRLIVGKLRLGMSDKTIIDGLSWVKVGDKSLNKIIEKAYGVRADLGEIAKIVLLKDDIEQVAKITVIPGIPIAAKLVQREKTVEGLFARLGNCFIQPKFDGLRMQLHYSQIPFTAESLVVSQSLFSDELQSVKLFSRNLEDYTKMFPDVALELQRLGVQKIVLDSEVIGFDPQTQKLLPFQQTTQRKRKDNIAVYAKQIPVKVFCFDILYIESKGIKQQGDLTNLSLTERQQILEKVISQGKSQNIVAAETVLTTSGQQLQQLFDKYKEQGLEGLIAKSVDSKYKPGTRDYDWIKLKVASQAGLADTIDAVVLGYYNGTGVRAKFGIGAILVGTYDTKMQKFISLTKIGTGIKDEDFKTIKNRLDQIKVNQVPANVEIDKILTPDVIVEPEVVVVVEADQISKSQMYKTGFSLRFPRLKEFDRDKNPDQVTSLSEIKDMYKLG